MSNNYFRVALRAMLASVIATTLFLSVVLIGFGTAPTSETTSVVVESATRSDDGIPPITTVRKMKSPNPAMTKTTHPTTNIEDSPSGDLNALFTRNDRHVEIPSDNLHAPIRSVSEGESPFGTHDAFTHNTNPVRMDRNAHKAFTSHSPAVTLSPNIEPFGQPHPQPKRNITFRAVEPWIPTPSQSNNEFHARMAAMEKRLDEIAQQKQSPGELERATQMLRDLQYANQLQMIQQQIEQLRSSGQIPPGSVTPPSAAAVQPQPETPPSQKTTTDTGVPASVINQSTESENNEQPPVLQATPTDAEERFSLKVHDTEMNQVLEMLGQMAGKNILAGTGISGKISANLNDVTVQEALEGLLRSHGYAFEERDNFIFVMTAEEAEQRRQRQRQIITKIYRPHYVSVKELQSLVTPLMTEGVGKIAVTAANEVGIPFDSASAGGDQLAQQDALLIQDYAEVISEIDAVVGELDIPPMQVVIEAMILSVKLTDSMEFGVNFALLSSESDNLFVSGNGQAVTNSTGFPQNGDGNLLPPAAEFIANTAGLKYGMIRGDAALFIKALEGITDTNLIASPQLRVINKQKAELIIGDRISYKTLAFNGTQTVENVNFLDSGTKLVLRPFISPDGQVRLEVHPERSSAVIDTTTQLPNQATTEVTTNVMVQDGMTAVIGGLIEEQSVEQFDRVPLLGAIPLVGNAFRNRTERTERTELIVLLTPRIVREPETAFQDEATKHENLQRREHFRNHLAPVNRRNLARMHREKAQQHFDRGELEKAKRHIELALRHSKNDQESLRLKAMIDQATGNRWKKLPLIHKYWTSRYQHRPHHRRIIHPHSVPVHVQQIHQTHHATSVPFATHNVRPSEPVRQSYTLPVLSQPAQFSPQIQPPRAMPPQAAMRRR